MPAPNKSRLHTTSDLNKKHLRTGDKSVLSSAFPTGLKLVWQGATNTGFDARVVLRHFKGYQFTTKMVLRYAIKGVLLKQNTIFDLPSSLLAHALTCGTIEGYSSIGDILADQALDAVLPIKTSFAERLWFFRPAPKGHSLDQAGPRHCDGFQRKHKALVVQCGLRGEDDAPVILYSLRKGTLTRASESSTVGPVLDKNMAVHSGHGPLEKVYVQTKQSINLVGLLGVGENEEMIPLDTLSDRRATTKFTPATVDHLAAQDPSLDILRKGSKALKTAFENGSDAWKEMHPVSASNRRWLDADTQPPSLLWQGQVQGVQPGANGRAAGVLQRNLHSTTETAPPRRKRPTDVLGQYRGESFIGRDCSASSRSRGMIV